MIIIITTRYKALSVLYCIVFEHLYYI